MRGAVVSADGVGVKLLLRCVAVGEVGLVLPGEEVFRSGGADRAYALRLPTVFIGASGGEVAPVGTIFAAHFVEVGDVLRIKSSGGDDGFFTQQRPVDSIRRLIGLKGGFLLSQFAVAISGQGFVTGLGWTLGIGVEKRSEVVHAVTVPDDVVFLGAVEFKQPQLGLDPVNAVPALGVADKGPVGFHRHRFVRRMGAAVVHAVEIAILKQRVVSGGVSLPRFIAGDDDLARLGLVQLQLHVLHALNEKVIDEQLPTGAEVNGICGGNGGPEKADGKGAVHPPTTED